MVHHLHEKSEKNTKWVILSGLSSVKRLIYVGFW